tara:strand:- start:12 stop:1109 length:1098 start_codon:yes stop_codon:yes gene_type:complete
MKVVFDFKIFFQQKYGGPSRYFFNLFEHINKKDNLDNAYIVSPIYYNEFLTNSEFKNKIIGIKLPKIKYTGSFYKAINKSISNYIINNFKPDLIHTTDYSIYTKKKLPLVVTVHDLIHEIYHKDFAKEKNYRPKKKILSISDHIICVSENTKKDLIEYYNVDEKKISVIYHGNTFDNFSLSSSNKKFDFKFFLFVGSRKRYKNFFKVVEAFKKNEQIYNEFKIICFGGGELLKSEKEKLLENDIDLKKIIVIENSSDESLFNLYRNATALIYPSIYEGFGMPIVEAMSLGCPVISSNSSSLPEVYKDAALSFFPSSTKELTNKMLQVAYDDQVKKKIVDLGLKQSKNFSWEKCIDKTLSVYKKVI